MKKKPHTIPFIIVLCIVSSLLLSFATDILTPYQEEKKEAFTKKQILLCSGASIQGSAKEILARFNKNFSVKLLEPSGAISTFASLQIDQTQYEEKYRKIGFYKARDKMFYEKKDGSGFVIPIDGYGLWGPIHGYLALKKDALTIEGLTFYDHMETPGLGGEISNVQWTGQFKNKRIIHDKEILTLDAPVFSIYVVKHAQKMALALQDRLRSVDAISGASVTSIGVQKAFAVCLKAYRPLILQKHEEYERTKAS